MTIVNAFHPDYAKTHSLNYAGPWTCWSASFWISHEDPKNQHMKFETYVMVLLVVLCLGTELSVLVLLVPVGASELIVWRVLGLLDAIAMTVLAY